MRQQESGGQIAWLGAALSLALFAFFLILVPDVTDGMTFVAGWSWVPALGVDFSFLVDGLSLLFALIISGIGTLIFTYSAGYFKGFPLAGRVLTILLLFMFSMLGLVLAENIITLFVFWELTTITSYLLIGTNHKNADARRYAMQALLVTVAGGLAFLAGLMLLGAAAGTYSLSGIIAQDLTSHALYLPIFVLIFIGCITKSALFPFHFWLPNAMAAPTPISAFLHSATMVKAGLYVLARLHPSLSGTEVWYWSLVVLGTITAVWGSVQALKQTDMKLMLAYTTLMALGTIALFLAVESPYAIMAAMMFVVVHALYKAALFMVVGNIEKASGTRDWRVVSGLKATLPMTTIVAMLAGLSMSGLPPFFGFIGKEMLLKGALTFSAGSWFVLAGMLFASFAMVAVGLMIATKPFYGHLRGVEGHKVKSLPWQFILPPAVLGVLGLAFGLLPAPWVESVLQAAAGQVYHPSGDVELKLWHGFNQVLALSVGVVALGVLGAYRFATLHSLATYVVRLSPVSGNGVYRGTLKMILRVARWQAAALQNGRQRFYLSVVFLTLSAGIWLTYLYRPFLDFSAISWFEGVPVYLWGLAGLMLVAVCATVFSASRMLAICALGIVGTLIALLFVVFSAPDVAMTQFMVEILVVIILTTVLLKLPVYHKFSSHKSGSHKSIRALPWGRIRDGALAVATGSGMTVLMLSVINEPFNTALNEFYQLASYTEAHGRNIVNVILVDFRAVDTLGEITVVAVAGLACYALIKLRKEKAVPKQAQHPVHNEGRRT